MNAVHVLFSMTLAWFVLIVVLLIKTELAYRWHIKILEAIHAYVIHKIERKEYRTAEEFEADRKMMDKMESLDDTSMRLWDWGYKRIVPPEILEKIRPYIK